MSKKETVTNMTGLPIPLAELTLGVAQTETVELDETVQNYIDNGSLAVAKKGKDS